MIRSIAKQASSALLATTTPLPAASPSAFTTRGRGRGADMALRLVGVVEDRERRRGDPMALAEPLHEGLRPLEPRRGPAGPERSQPSRLERVDEAEGQRELRTDDNEVGALGHGQLDEARDVVHADLCVASHRRRSRVAGRDDDLVPARRDRRRQRVLARSGTDDHDSLADGHRRRLTGARNTLPLRTLGPVRRRQVRERRPRQPRPRRRILPPVGDAPAPPPPPAAIRITRPYANEDDYLDRELETLTRASITLLGAQSRPQGVVLRFELALSSGVVLMRGEGRVVGFKPNAFEGLGGLTLRFTRLDTRSKALVDKAVALREKRRPSIKPQTTDPVEVGADRQAGQPEPTRESISEAAAPEPAAVLPPPPPSSTPESAAQPAQRTAAAAPSSAPAPPSSAERDSLLERLRTRARALNPSDIARILAERRRA